MFVSTLIRRRRIRLLVLISAAAFLIYSAFAGARTKPLTICKTDKERAAFCESYGVSVDPSPVWVKKTVVPNSFDSGYERINARLKAAGFSLDAVRSKEVTVYCYRVPRDSDVCVRVYCDGDAVIGAEIEDLV